MNNKEVEKLFMLLVRGNDSRCGDEILKELNQNGFLVFKSSFNEETQKMEYEMIKTDLFLCQ